MLLLWLRMPLEGRRRVWPLYGRFCALMLCGSCFGAVTWAARMIQLVDNFKGNDAGSRRDRVQLLSSFARSYSWGAVFQVMYAIEFMCLSAAKLMVLDRMSDFAAGQDEVTRKRWAAGGRMVMAVVVLGNAVGLAANVAAAVHGQSAADASGTAAALLAANSTQNVQEYSSFIRTEVQLSISIASVQQFCEVAVLLLIVAACVTTGVVCARRISSVLLGVNDASAPAVVGKELKRRMVGTTAFVFVTFVVRSVQSTMSAVARQLQDSGRRCPGGQTSFCDPSCNNEFTHMQHWMSYTPEFQTIIVLISSPLALLVALWGMTPRLTLQRMQQSKQEVTMTGQLLGSRRSFR
jgi:hypothetical protein